MTYDVIGVRADGTVIKNPKRWRKAPKDEWLFGWGQQKKCAVVIRFWPSKKGWMPLDIRGARIVTQAYAGQSGARYCRLVGARRGRVFPNEEAAIMYAIHKLAAQPEFDFAAQ